MKLLLACCLVLVGTILPSSIRACLWDSDTLADEKASNPKMAEAVLGKPPNLGNPSELRKRIKKLEANRRENDPAWWNDLAGAYIRLGNSTNAAKLLESVVARFPNDYGIHANLGTAYHLLGRYAEAEKEIARDLEINPSAHFGLEVYHLALLQYLAKDDAYKRSHVYLDEFTGDFISDEKYERGPLGPDFQGFPMLDVDQPELVKKFDPTRATNGYPAYRLKWDLENDTNRENGVLYMASLNPREPACFVMLGITCLAPAVPKSQDLNLAYAAFEKAIVLGSPQTAILKKRVALIKKHIIKSQADDPYAPTRSEPLASRPSPNANASSDVTRFVFAALVIGGLVSWWIIRSRRAS
jgi:tetratricopeptide (TPR) repeat protein